MKITVREGFNRHKIRRRTALSLPDIWNVRKRVVNGKIPDQQHYASCQYIEEYTLRRASVIQVYVHLTCAFEG